MASARSQWVRCAACVLTAVALAPVAGGARAERPAGEVTEYVADLREAAKLAADARSAAGSLTGGACPTFAPAAQRVTTAATAARDVFTAYRRAQTRYGTQEEIRLISELATSLREARGHLGRAAGEIAVASAAERAAAEKEVSLFQQVVAVKVADRLQVEGLEEVLTSRSLGEVRRKVVAELGRRVRARAEAELKRLVGVPLRLGVPLRQQLRDLLEAELSSTLAKLSVAAGPAGIVVSLVGSRLVSLLGAKLQEALRQKGKLDERTKRTLDGFARLQQGLRTLPKDATTDRVRSLVRSVEAALKATAFLEGDARRARRADLLGKLQAGAESLRRTLAVARMRFLLDSDLVGEDFGIAVAYANATLADVERLSRKLGCPPPGSGSSGGGDKGKPPTVASCPPPFKMESSSGTGQFDITTPTIQRVNPDDPYWWKCVYLHPQARDEVFVVFFSITPPDAPGRLPSGDCGRTSANPLASEKRYLSVAGGERRAFTRAVGGNEKVLLQALALAEAQGVGAACARS